LLGKLHFQENYIMSFKLSVKILIKFSFSLLSCPRSITRSQQTSDLLTDVTTSSHTRAHTTVTETITAKQQQQQRQSLLLLSSSTQTPSLNLVGTSLKVNLNNLFSENHSKSSIDLSYRSESSHKTDIATSPIRFVALSPTCSLAPVYKESTNSTGNETRHCEELWEKSVEKIEFSYSEIKGSAEKADTTIVTSCSDVTNITRTTDVASEDEYDWMKDLDKKTLLNMNKSLAKRYKESLERSKRLSLNGSSSGSVASGCSGCSCGVKQDQKQEASISMSEKAASGGGTRKPDSPSVGWVAVCLGCENTGY